MPGETTVYNLPIFPLNAVLFPKMPLALRIFEERYKVMVHDLPILDNRFCVALIREGTEVGGPAEPYEVACLAEVQSLRPLPQGMLFLEAVGVERVRITRLNRTKKPYLVGSLELWPDGTTLADKALVERVSRLFEDYAGCLMTLAGQKVGAIPPPSDPEMLSYLLATVLDINSQERQRLLQLPDSISRLRDEEEVLRAELPMLQAIANSPRPPDLGGGKFSAN